ncbi:hypothetical protein FRC07_011406, partial [Ceratobasidium sp. 392]
MSSSNTLLNGKKILIIGGTSGIGRGVAVASICHEASVVIASSSEAKVKVAVEALKQGVRKEGITVTGQAFDMRDSPALTKFLSDNGPFDHLVGTYTFDSTWYTGLTEVQVFTAGDQTSLGRGFPDVEIDDRVKGQFDTRYWAPMIAAQFAYKNKLFNSGGSLIMTMGAAFYRPPPGWALVAGIVGAVESATRGLAVDLKPIRVNTVIPGLVASEFWDDLPEDARNAMYETKGKELLVGHVGTPDEVAEAYIFAMKDLTMDAGLEELVLSGALFNGGEEGKKSPVRSRSVTPEPNTDDELFGSDISRPASPADGAQASSSIGMGPGRTGVKGVIRDRAEARTRENARRAQEIAALNSQMEKAAITARTYKEDEEAARKEAEEEEQSAKERYRRRRWRELKERATGGNAG